MSKFIQGAIKRPGQLHRDLGVAQGQTIPRGAIEAAAKQGGKIGERARFALTLEGMRKKKRQGPDSTAIAKAAAGKSGY